MPSNQNQVEYDFYQHPCWDLYNHCKLTVESVENKFESKTLSSRLLYGDNNIKTIHTLLVLSQLNNR